MEVFRVGELALVLLQLLDEETFRHRPILRRERGVFELLLPLVLVLPREPQDFLFRCDARPVRSLERVRRVAACASRRPLAVFRARPALLAVSRDAPDPASNQSRISSSSAFHAPNTSSHGVVGSPRSAA